MVDEAAQFEQRIDAVQGLQRRGDRESEGFLVFEGTDDDGSPRQVELRSPADHALTDRVHEQFMQTAHAWFMLEAQPSIVEVLAFGPDPKPWVLVDGAGEPLSALGPPLGPETVADIVGDVAEALEVAMADNLAHSDLSPDAVRVLQGDNSQARVDEWGIRRIVGSHAGQYITPYTAPEQVDGRWTSQTDVYGLAATAYFALTGRPPFQAAAEAIRGGEPVPPAEVVETVPPAVSELIHETLTRPPEARAKNPQQFAAEFEAAMQTGRQAGAAGGAAAGAAAGAASAPPAQGADSQAAAEPSSQPAQQQPPEPTQEASPQPGQQASPQETPEEPGDKPGSEGLGQHVTRRRVLAAGGAVGVLAALGAGAAFMLGSGGSGLGLSAVPPRAQGAAAFDMDSLLNESAFRDSLDQSLSQSTATPGSVASILDDVETTAGIDPREVESGVAFAATQSGPSRYVGMVLETSLSPSTVRDQLAETHGSLRLETYNEQQVLIAQSPQLPWELRVAPMEDGRVAVGTEPEVQDAIDVQAGSVEPVGGNVRQGFEAADDGPVRAGFVIPESLPPDTPGRSAISQLGALVDYGSGSVSVGETTSASVAFTAPSASDAKTLESNIDLGLTLVNSPVGQQGIPDRYKPLLEDIHPVANRVELTRDGSTVTVRLPAVAKASNTLYEVLTALA